MATPCRGERVQIATVGEKKGRIASPMPGRGASSGEWRAMANRLFVLRFAEARMPRLSAEPIMMTPAHEQVPTRLVRAHTTPRKLAERAQLILLTAAGTSVRETARQLGVWPKTARHWLRRWRAAAESTQIAQRLADAPRPGAPATFAPEQICAIPGTSPGTALACERPAEASDLPLSHWSRSELARCASRLRRGRLRSRHC